MIFSSSINLPCTTISTQTLSSSSSPRVSFSSSPLHSTPSFLSLPRSSLPFPCLNLGFRAASATSIARSFGCCRGLSSIHVNAMADLVEDNKNVVASIEDEQVIKPSHSRTFLDARTEEELLSGIQKEVDMGRLPPSVAAGMEELFQNYRNAVLQSGAPKANEIVVSNMAAALDRILLDVEDPFVFEPHHKAVREPFDYYQFGQSYIRPLIDFRNSYVGNLSIFKEMEEKLQQGHNIVIISNHQTEADPAVIALLLETTNSSIAENLIYVAGDRVITDPLCKPFSIGRNLICVYSKKHMLDVPELVEAKKKANIRSLKEMAVLLRGGSQIVWIAPSGGRDRPDPTTGDFFPAHFDSSSVDNMRRLAEHSGAPGHVYPLALLCYEIMPPPAQVEKEIGEKRVVNFSGAGLSVAPEIKFSEIASTYENPEEARVAYSQALYHTVTEQYNVLKSAILGKQGLEASTPNVVLSQPWN